MKKGSLFLALFAGLAVSAAAPAFAACDPLGTGACCEIWAHNGECLSEVDCSVCAPTPDPFPTPDPEPLPDEPFPYPDYPSCGDMGPC